jgi:hypothetical protein
MKMCTTDKTRATNAVDLLNDFVGDFVTGTMSLARFHAEHNSGSITAEQLAGINKMCLSHLILGLTKWAEFYDKFHDLIPSEFKDTAKTIKKTIENRKVIEFRHKCVGHIWDKDTNRPLVNSEIMTRLETITNNDIKGFLRWLNNPDTTEYPKSVAGVCESIRDKIALEHGVMPSDVLQR